MKFFVFNFAGSVLMLGAVVLTTVLAAAQDPPSAPDPTAAAPPAPSSPATIRSVNIEILEIFDEPEIGLFYRTVNSLKLQTRDEVVRRELLLKEGDTYDPFLVDESLRNLRSLSFLREVSIRPVFDGPYVDLIVSVQDTWTLFPFITLSSGGGTSRSAVGIAESNLGGYGKRVEALVADDEGRQKVEAIWQDPRVFGSLHQMTVGHFQRSDGNRTVVSYGRPFRSLVEPQAWSTAADVSDLVGRLFEAGEERYIFRQEHIELSGGYTLSFGDPKEQRRRFTAGYSFEKDDFTQADRDDFEDIDLSFDPRLNNLKELPEDRRFSGPYFAFQQIKQDFVSLNYVDRFERVQDFNIGNEFNAAVQLAPQFMDSLEDTLLFGISDSEGWHLSTTSFLRGAIGANLRVDQEGAENAFIRAEGKYVNVTGEQYAGDIYLGKHTLVGSLVLDHGESLDGDVELLLGAGNGLRGYEDRTFSGDQRVILNLEDRFHLVEDVLRLFSVGGAFFLDAGGTSRNGVGDVIKDELYGDFGIGLRIGLPRSSGGNVIRFDIAFPLRDGPDDSQKLEPRFLFTTGQLFNPFLSTERSGGSPQISGGLLP